MIQFDSINQERPYLYFKEKYDEAANAGQKSIEAISISSFNAKIHEVDSRYVNLKFIANDEFIFFSNYNSPKALSFNSHRQIAALLYWPSINTQIRMKARLKKTTQEFNQEYFFDRSEEKNALAISSNQSDTIVSYEQIKKNYNEALKNADLKKCPDSWGGFSFTPYYFEFWEGHNLRINKREAFVKNNDIWSHDILQP